MAYYLVLLPAPGWTRYHVIRVEVDGDATYYRSFRTESEARFTADALNEVERVTS